MPVTCRILWVLLVLLLAPREASAQSIVMTSPTNQPNIRLGEGLLLEAQLPGYTGAVSWVEFHINNGSGMPPLVLTASNAPFRVLWTNNLCSGYYAVGAKATFPDGISRVSQPVYVRNPNYVEISRPAQGAVFSVPVDIRLSVRVLTSGSYDVRIVSNVTNTIAHVFVRVDPPGGCQGDSVTYDWKSVPPGEYTLQAALGDLYTSTGRQLPGAVSPPVSFVVLDRSTAADADGDGMPDPWEIRYGLDPLRPEDAKEDADGDGLSNYDEMLAGTDPRDAQSKLSIQLVRVSEGWLELFFPCSGGKLYHLERSNALGPVGWSLLGDPSIGSSSGLDGFRVPTNQLNSGDLLRVVLEGQ